MTVTDMTDPNDKRRYPSEVHRRQRRKNLAMLAMLFGWAVLLYLVAILRMGGAS